MELLCIFEFKMIIVAKFLLFPFLQEFLENVNDFLKNHEKIFIEKRLPEMDLRHQFSMMKRQFYLP